MLGDESLDGCAILDPYGGTEEERQSFGLKPFVLAAIRRFLSGCRQLRARDQALFVENFKVDKTGVPPKAE